MELQFRIEQAKDHIEVENVIFKAFETMELLGRVVTTEHFLTYLLREDMNFISELDIVVEYNNRIVGSILYSKSKILRYDGTETESITFGPFGVLPELHGKGIGSKLLNYSMDLACKLGYKSILIIGHPNYYKKFGFIRASDYNLTLEDGSTMEEFLALELISGELGKAGGRWKYAKALEISENDQQGFKNYCKLRNKQYSSLI